MLVFSALLATLGAPSSDVPYVFESFTVSPPLREVRFGGGKKGRYLVRGDQAGDVTPIVAWELLEKKGEGTQAAEVVDKIEGARSLSAQAGREVLLELGVKNPPKLLVGEGRSGGVFVARVYARTTAKGGGSIVASYFQLGPQAVRTDKELFVVEPSVQRDPSAPPPPASKDVEAFWKIVNAHTGKPPK